MRPWTKADDDAVLAMCAKGMVLREIAPAIGRHRSTISKKMHGVSGYPRPSQKKPKHVNRPYLKPGPKGKLNDQKAAEIRALQGKHGAGTVGQMYGVAKSTVQKIWQGEIWNKVYTAQ